MEISPDRYEAVLDVNIDEHRTNWSYKHWEKEFPHGTHIFPHIEQIAAVLGKSFTRSEIISFYQQDDILPETKFVAAMIWGHEAPAGSKRDPRGPWKISEMFSDVMQATDAIRGVSVEDREGIVSSYKSLNKALNQCGPNFFTKHFYFLGKSLGIERYPLIFDDRVAAGLIKLSLSDASTLEIVKVITERNPKAYLRYLSFTWECADRIHCEPDQI